MDHAKYQQRVKLLTGAQLRFIIHDAKAAIEAMPDGHKAGHYADEVSYAAMELMRREREMA